MEVVDVANMALGMLVEAAITADDITNDTNVAARLFNLHYDLTRRAELQRHAWVFAIMADEEADGDVVADTPSGGLGYSYDYPADALRVFPPTYDGQPHGVPISWRREGALIYSDQSPLVLRYIIDVTDPDEWSPAFAEVMVAALARKLALPITHKANMVQIAQNAYDNALSAALRTNAIERSGRLQTQTWAQARGDYSIWWV